MGQTHTVHNKRTKSYIVTELSGTNLPERFFETVTLTSAAAATPVNVMPDARVGPGRKVYLEGGLARVNGTTVWGTTATVKVQDTNGIPVDLITLAVAGLGSQSRLSFINQSNVTLEDAYSKGTGTTVAKGIQVVGDVNGTGSDLIVTVWGWIK